MLIGGIAPTQYVHPWEHGTEHQKATGWWLSSTLPVIRPSFPVEGRDRSMANSPQNMERSVFRSRSYIGMAGAMAAQWMPTLIYY